ncbi:MAG: polysaccharide biosynthesis tyrosine autokinase [Bacteroidetes bacterium]|nr:polysaccharide biosynthesis tyrosine autokinase [Bacteroidota bacterium]
MSEPFLKNTQNSSLFNEKTFQIKDIIIKYSTFLPLFILSIALSLATGYIYLRYTTKIYRVNGSMLVGGGQSTTSNGQVDLINSALYGTRSVNMQNEIEAIRSRILLESMVRKNNFNYYYYNLGKIKNSDISDYAPFTLKILSIPDTNLIYTFNISELAPKSLSINLNNGPTKRVQWGDTNTINKVVFIITASSKINEITKEPFQVKWTPPAFAVGDIQSKLSIGGLSEKSSILNLGMRTDNPTRAVNVLNALMIEVQKRDVFLKKEIAFRTIDFIDERMDTISKEIDKIEEEILLKKGDPRFNNPQDENSYYSAQLSDIELKSKRLAADNMLSALLVSFINDDKNKGKPIPLYVFDGTAVSDLTKQYNNLIMGGAFAQKDNTEDGLAISTISYQLKEVKKKLLETLKYIQNENNNQIIRYRNESNSILDPLGKLPIKQREVEELKRQKSIKDQLYAYLLQKKEETSITSLSAQSNYTILENASMPGSEFEPQVSKIISFCVLIGLIIPIVVIFLIELFNDKVTLRDDITKKTSIPIIGEIIHSSRTDLLVVLNNRNVISEQFRIMRANLQFLLTNNGQCKTLMITSSIGGEGKSFTSRNLAAVLALANKKVILLQFDIRKIQPSIGKQQNTNTSVTSKGIVNYLIGQIDNHEEIIQDVEGFPNLKVIEPGPIPPNPAELLLSPLLGNLVEKLKKEYEYIIMDTAPVGIVGDAFILAPFADCILYLVRQRFTLKKQLDFIMELNENKKLPNMAIIVNDVQVSGRYNYYGYNSYAYAYRYGYGYAKGYGYFGKRKGSNGYTYFDSDSKQRKGFFARLFNTKE